MGYVDEIVRDEPWGYWRLDSIVPDVYGFVEYVSGTPDAYGKSMAVNTDPIFEVPAGSKIDGHSALFNGVSQYTATNSYPDLSMSSYSAEVWFKTTNGSADQPLLLAYTYGSRGKFKFYLNAGVVKFGVFISYYTLAALASSPDPWNDGIWHHLVGVVDDVAGELRLYIDGELQDTQTFTPGSLITPMYSKLSLSCYSGYSGGQPMYVGSMDEVVFYDKVLPFSRIVAHYHRGMGLHVGDAPIGIRAPNRSVTTLEPYSGEDTAILISVVLTGRFDPILPPPTPPVDSDGIPNPTIAPLCVASDTTDGHLLSGAYRYAYAAWVGYIGQATAPSPWSEEVILTTDDTVTLTYPTIPGADGYIVYRMTVST